MHHQCHAGLECSHDILGHISGVLHAFRLHKLLSHSYIGENLRISGFEGRAARIFLGVSCRIIFGNHRHAHDIRTCGRVIVLAEELRKQVIQVSPDVGSFAVNLLHGFSVTFRQCSPFQKFPCTVNEEVRIADITVEAVPCVIGRSVACCHAVGIEITAEVTEVLDSMESISLKFRDIDKRARKAIFHAGVKSVQK